MKRMEAIAREYGLILEWGNSVHLVDSHNKGIASIHTVGCEKDITINPKYERARELFGALSREIFGAFPQGPVEWRTVTAAGSS